MRSRRGDVLFQVETDKAVLDVESQFEGTILKIVTPAGVEVPVMTTAAIIGTPGEEIPAEMLAAAPKAAPAPSGPRANSRSGSGGETRSRSETGPGGWSGPGRAAARAPAGSAASARSGDEEAGLAAGEEVRRRLPRQRGEDSGRRNPGHRAGCAELSGIDRLLRPQDHAGRPESRQRVGRRNGRTRRDRRQRPDHRGGCPSGDCGAAAGVQHDAAGDRRPADPVKQTIPHFYVTVAIDLSGLMAKRKALKAEESIFRSTSLSSRRWRWRCAIFRW
ncbi:MAG: hypothetical protein L6W00_13755 [Lentisphaeria bacterium]|nr:MAG: hypothetical protein L6W00_13755 [Lentisphaeria bacterium]